MEWKLKSFTSKVAGRIFTLFILCALLPIGLLAVLSFHQVTKQLKEQSRAQLRQASRTEGMSILEHLDLLDAELKMIVAELRSEPSGAERLASSDLHESTAHRFDALAILRKPGNYEPIFGRLAPELNLSVDEEAHIRSGGILLKTDACSGHMCGWMIRPLDAQRTERGSLVGQVNLNYLWSDNNLPAQTEIVVLDGENRLLFSSSGATLEFSKELQGRMSHTRAGEFEMRNEDRDVLVDFWSIFLKPKYFAPRWVVVASVPRKDVLAPLISFKRIFPLVTLLAVWVVLLLSPIQIRRNLVPLEKLQEGTQRIAERDFDCRVDVKSGDEFQELATSFNAMAAQLGRQFKALSTINEIDRAILSSSDTEKILDALFAGLNDLLPFDAASITLLDRKNSPHATAYIATGKTDTERKLQTIEVRLDELQELSRSAELRAYHRGELLPGFLAPLERLGIRSYLVLPIMLKGNISGFLSLGYLSRPDLSAEDMVQVRQVTDQMAVALANARLIEDLELLSNGTLMALARAIDAKSSWTAGHSERVTNMAVRIARAMRLPPEDLKILYRGGLMHDIGKIGVPASLLGKPAKLTTEEFQTMSEHVRTGARILEPIPGFAELIPIVLYHHERYDGAGYPEGLAGEQIPLYARIFAVADVYDALRSDRPYRDGMPRERVASYIQENAGSQFDPKVVRAMLEVLAEEERAIQREEICAPIADAD